MNSKRKLIISLSALAVVAVIAVVAIIGVLAASQQTLTSRIKVQYIARDVSATVSAKYYIMNLEEGDTRDEPKESGDFLTEGGDNSITFDTESNYTVPPTLEPSIASFNLESEHEHIYFEYCFTNHSSTSYIKLTPGFNRGSDNRNMGESFYKGKAEEFVIGWGDYQILGPNETMYATLCLSIQEAKDDANYSLNLTWNMEKVTEIDNDQEFLDKAEISNGTLSRYVGNATAINIPNNVTTISKGAFSAIVENDNGNEVLNYSMSQILKEVYIPASVTSIGASVFEGCFGLETIEVDENNPKYKSVNNCIIDKDTGTIVAGCNGSNIPTDPSITTIGVGAFRGYSNETIVIPSNITTIGEKAFTGAKESINGTDTPANVSQLKYITIPASVTSIANYAFQYQNDLTSVIFENGIQLTSIGSYAFQHCSALQSLTLPASLTTIGTTCFSGCQSLSTVNFESGIKITEIPKSAFSYTAITTIAIPDSVKTIKGSAFQECTQLSSIDLNKVETIESVAFYNCIKLKTITIPDTVIKIGYNTFASKDAVNHMTYLQTLDCSTTGWVYYEYTYSGSAKTLSGVLSVDIVKENSNYTLERR